MLKLYEPKIPYFEMKMKDLLKHVKIVKKLDFFFNGNYNKNLDEKTYKKIFCRKTRKRMKIENKRKTRKRMKRENKKKKKKYM